MSHAWQNRLRRTGLRLAFVVAALWPVAIVHGQGGGEPCPRGVIEFHEKASWINAVGSYVTADFTGFSKFTVITDQYADIGVVFTDGDDNITGPSKTGFPEDGWGITSFATPFCLQFSSSMNWIAADFPGNLQIFLLRQGEFIYYSDTFGLGGPGQFGGLVSLEPFDAAVVVDDDPGSFMDDLHFGAGTPTFVPGDTTLDGTVDVEDLVQVITSWGTCPGGHFCHADTNCDDLVDVVDLVTVILNWSAGG